MSRCFALCWVFRWVLVQQKAASFSFFYLSPNRGFLHSQPSHVEVKEGKNAYNAAGKCSAKRGLGTSTQRRHAYTVCAGSRGSRRRCFWKIIQHTHKRRLFLIIIDGSGKEKHCSVTRFPVYNKYCIPGNSIMFCLNQHFRTVRMNGGKTAAVSLLSFISLLFTLPFAAENTSAVCCSCIKSKDLKLS